jgi:hypothetical protein
MKENGRYRLEDDYHCIDIVLTSILQLFDGRDPSPFKERDLEEDFSRYLILAIREIGVQEKVKLVIKMQEHHPSFLKAKDVEEAIYTYYSFELENSRNDLRVLFKQGRSTLAMGLAFLAACYTGYYFTKDQATLFWGFLGEGLHVMGWVAMWKPINLFLYEWWPIKDRMALMSSLQHLKVEIVTG